MKRVIKTELLDILPANDPGAMGSRRDLRRVNALIGTAAIMARALDGTLTDRAPQSIVELGAGDGTCLLSLAKCTPPRKMPLRTLLVDRQSVVSAETRAEFAALSWNVETIHMDIFDWLDRPDPEPIDVTVASLSLHHFAENELRKLFAGVAKQTRTFVACEPRRAAFPLAASYLLGFIGVNSVTRHDGRISVRAGFAEKELSRLWAADAGWNLTERSAGLFSHLFAAHRIGASGAGPNGG